MRKIDELSADERLELATVLGNVLLNLPLAATLLGHTHPLSTIRGNYYHARPDDGEIAEIAAAFLRDLVSREKRTVEIVAKWYGPDAPRNLLNGRVSATEPAAPPRRSSPR